MTRAALLAAAALVAVPGAAAANEQPKPRYGGTVVIGTVGEDATLNLILSGGGSVWSQPAHMLVYGGAFKVAPDATYRPSLVSHGTVERRSPTVVILHIRRDARWSDGRPITAADFLMFCRVVRSYGVGIWKGHPCAFAQLRAVDSKRVRVTFDRVFPGWRPYFTAFPRHALEGVDFRGVWQTSLDNPKTGRAIGSGPFLLDDWRRGHSMTFVRNPRYFGKRPYLDRIVVRFLSDAQAVAAALRRGDIDVDWTAATATRVAELRRDRRVVVRSALGRAWEQLTFNLGHRGGGHAALRKRFVREAIARGIDRLSLVRALWADEAPNLPVLQSIYLLQQHPEYRPWWARYRHDPAQARRVLVRNGCVRGADAVFVCDGQRLSFRLTTTAGSPLRQLAVQLIEQGLIRAGIDVRIENVPTSVFFAQQKPAGDYDLALFAYSADYPELIDAYDVYGCPRKDALQYNHQAYCNPQADRLLRAMSTEHDDRRRVELLNRALALVAHDLPTLPLYQRPAFIAHRSSVHGIRHNDWGPWRELWNVESWWKERAQ